MCIQIVIEDITDDDNSSETKREEMKIHFSKKERNNARCSELMEDTFSMRRKEIENTPQHVENIIAMYPLLTVYAEVKFAPMQ